MRYQCHRLIHTLLDTFVVLTANYSKQRNALATGGQGEVAAFLKVKQLSGLSPPYCVWGGGQAETMLG